MSTTPEPPPIVCTVDDVAALIRARTKDSNGNEAGTFTDDTRPTADQAQEAIDHQIALLHTKVGWIGETCTDLAGEVTAIGAAAEIELSYFSEQARTDRSPYTYLKTRYDEAIQGLYDCVAGNLPSGAGTPAGEITYRYGTLDAISGTVHAHYTGQLGPSLPAPPPPPEPDDG